MVRLSKKGTVAGKPPSIAFNFSYMLAADLAELGLQLRGLAGGAVAAMRGPIGQASKELDPAFFIAERAAASTGG